MAAADPAAREEAEASGCRSVFVGGLREEVTEDDLRTLFGIAYGVVSHIQMKRNFAFVDFANPAGAAAACRLDGHTLFGKALGVRLNLARFKRGDPRAAAEAQRMLAAAPPGLPAQQRLTAGPSQPLPPAASRPPPQPAPLPSRHNVGLASDPAMCTSVFIGGLPAGATSDQLQKICSQYGQVLKVTKPEGKKYAFVDMGSPVEAQAAVRAMDGQHPWGPQMGAIGVRLNLPEHKNAGKRSGTAAGLPGEPHKQQRMIAPPAPPRQAPPPGPDSGDVASIFFGGLPSGCTEDMITAVCSAFGTVMRTSMPGTGKYAFVDFAHPAEAHRAVVSLDGTQPWPGERAVGVRLNLPEFKHGQRQQQQQPPSHAPPPPQSPPSWAAPRPAHGQPPPQPPQQQVYHHEPYPTGPAAAPAGGPVAVATDDPAACCSIFLGSIPAGCGDKELGEFVQPYVVRWGRVTAASKKPEKTFGFVELSTPGAAQAAVDALNGVEWAGKRVACRLNLRQHKRQP